MLAALEEAGRIPGAGTPGSPLGWGPRGPRDAQDRDRPPPTAGRSARHLPLGSRPTLPAPSRKPPPQGLGHLTERVGRPAARRHKLTSMAEKLRSFPARREGSVRAEEPLFASLERAGEGAMVVDGEQRIRLWNRVAEELLGWQREEVLGRACHQVLCGHDVEGQRVCFPGCSELVMAASDEPIPPRSVLYRARDGRFVLLERSVLVISQGHEIPELWFVHLFRRPAPLRTDLGRRAERAPSDTAPETGRPAGPAPTPREQQVLALLMQGRSSREIARCLGTALSTARNHVQNLLRKLEARTRAEAVAKALEQGWVPRPPC